MLITEWNGMKRNIISKSSTFDNRTGIELHMRECLTQPPPGRWHWLASIIDYVTSSTLLLDKPFFAQYHNHLLIYFSVWGGRRWMQNQLASRSLVSKVNDFCIEQTNSASQSPPLYLSFATRQHLLKGHWMAMLDGLAIRSHMRVQLWLTDTCSVHSAS